MNTRIKIGLVLFTMVSMAVLIWFLSPGVTSEGSKSQKPKYVSDNWETQYDIRSKDPQGLHLTLELLSFSAKQHGAFNLIENLDSLKDETIINDTNLTLVSISEVFDVDYRQSLQLMSLVVNGANLFVSSNTMRNGATTTFLSDIGYTFDYNDDIHLHIPNDTLILHNIFQNDTIGGAWLMFDRSTIPDTFEILATNYSQPVFIHYQIGKGHVYLHTSPSLFMNYQMLTDAGFNQFDFVLNTISPKGNIAFLTGAQAVLDIDNRASNNESPESGGNKNDDSYLRYLLSKTAIKIALILALLGLLLFVIFRSKRIRPIVPYIPAKKDMSLAFAETITSIYLSKRNPSGMLLIMKRNFYDTVQKHFFIDLSRRNGDKELISLAEKSNVSLDQIKLLVSKFESPQMAMYSDKNIQEIQRDQHEFYRSAGILSNKLIETVKHKEITLNRSIVYSSFIILLGIALILMGLYLLTQANGIGVLFWPIGIAMLLLGIVRLGMPLFQIKKNTVQSYSLLGRKSVFNREEINSIMENKSHVILHFSNNRQLTINLWDLDSHDRRQLDQFVSSLQISHYD